MNTFDILAIKAIYKRSLLLQKNSNYQKLLILFEFWLNLYDLGIKNNINYSNNKIDSPILYFYEKEKIFFNINSRINKNYSFLIKIITKLYFSKIGYLQMPGTGKFKKLYRTIAHNIIDSFAMDIDKEMKENFQDQLLLLYEDKRLLNKIKINLPDYFFFKKNENNFAFNTIHCNPLNLFDPKLNKCFFFNNSISIIGYQHGSGYSEIQNFLLENFEKKISEKFYNWGLGENNISQNRFIKKKNKNTKIGIRKLYFVNSIKNFWFTYALTKLNKEDIELQFKMRYELNKKLPLKYKIKTKEHPKINNIENFDLFNSLLIFDYPFNTMLYQCIYQSIPFIFFINKNYEKIFTKEYSNLISFFRTNNLLYYYNETDELYDFIINKKYQKIFDKQMFKKIVSYIENVSEK